jgi:hypothetical protein
VGPAGRDAGEPREVVGIHLDELGDPALQVLDRQHPAHQRPLDAGRRAADARERAEGLRGRGRHVRRPETQQPARPVGDVGADPLAQRTDLGLAGRAGAEVLPRQPCGTQRDRPGDLGLLVGAAGDLQRAAADVEDRQAPGRPAEPAAYGEERQPGLVVPRQYGDADAGLGRDVVEDGVGVDRVTHGGGREAQHVLGAAVLGDDDGPRHELGQRLDPLRRHVPVVEVLGQAQRLLVGVRRKRGRTPMCVDDEQVPRVGADVEDAEAHAVESTVGAAPTLVRCQRSISSSPARSSSSSTRPTPTRCSAAT